MCKGTYDTTEKDVHSKYQKKKKKIYVDDMHMYATERLKGNDNNMTRGRNTTSNKYLTSWSNEEQAR